MQIVEPLVRIYLYEFTGEMRQNIPHSRFVHCLDDSAGKGGFPTLCRRQISSRVRTERFVDDGSRVNLSDLAETSVRPIALLTA